MPGTTLGSVHYFSPEQARGEMVTTASDIYSAGLVLFEMLTGRRAWGGDSAGAVAVARLTGDPPLPSSVQPGVPEVLDIAVMRALAREPGERPTASDMAALLDRYSVDPAGAAAWVSSAPAFAPTASTGALTGALTANSLAAASTVATPPTSAAGGGAGAPPGGAGYYSSPPPFDPTSDRYLGGPAYGTVRGGASPRRAAAPYAEEEPEQQSTNVWGWIAAVLGILVLFAGGLLLFLLVNRPGGSPAPSGTTALITLPSFVGETLENAQQDAEQLGLIMTVGSFQVSTDVEENTVIAQDPVAGGLVSRGSRVVVTVAAPSSTTLVPEVRLRTEPETFAVLAQAGLMPGLRSTRVRPDRPAQPRDPDQPARRRGGPPRDGYRLRRISRPAADAPAANHAEPLDHAPANPDSNS